MRDNLVYTVGVVKHHCIQDLTEAELQRRISAYMTEIYNIIMDYLEEKETRLQEEYDNRSKELIGLLREL